MNETNTTTDKEVLLRAIRLWLQKQEKKQDRQQKQSGGV